MWVCNNCDTHNNDGITVCEVCGAKYPIVDIDITNTDDSDGSGNVHLKWTGDNVYAAFFICMNTAGYLTNTKGIVKDIPIPTSETTLELYFCSSGSWVKKSYNIRSTRPEILFFHIQDLYATEKKVEYNDTVILEWCTQNCKHLSILKEYEDGSVESHKTIKTSGSIAIICAKPMKVTLLEEDEYGAIVDSATVTLSVDKTSYPQPIIFDIKQHQKIVRVGDAVSIKLNASNATNIYFNNKKLPLDVIHVVSFDSPGIKHIEYVAKSKFEPSITRQYTHKVEVLDRETLLGVYSDGKEIGHDETLFLPKKHKSEWVTLNFAVYNTDALKIKAVDVDGHELMIVGTGYDTMTQTIDIPEHDWEKQKSIEIRHNNRNFTITFESILKGTLTDHTLDVPQIKQINVCLSRYPKMKKIMYSLLS